MTSGAVHDPRFTRLIEYLSRVPPVQTNDTPGNGFGSGAEGDNWWVKFAIDIDHPLAWSAVQEMAHVLNYLSPSERLPTVFKPVSPPPYMNGGPRDFLSWVIEGHSAMSPDETAKWLEGRLPRPVEDRSKWPEAD